MQVKKRQEREQVQGTGTTLWKDSKLRDERCAGESLGGVSQEEIKG